jgi:hypothetical protein
MLRVAVVEMIYNQTVYNLFNKNLLNLIQIAQQTDKSVSEMNN